MWQELTWFVFFGGLLGLAFLGRRRAIFLYSTLIIYFVFSWGYRFGNWFQVIVPAYPIFIIGFVAGINRISSFIKNQEISISRFTVQISRFTFYVLLMGLLLYRFTTNLPRANQRNLPIDTGLDPGWAILADNPASPALISGDFAERVALQYLKTIWSIAPLIYPTDAGDFAPPPGVEPDSVYISRRAMAMTSGIIQPGEVYPQAVGEQLIALWPAPRTELPDKAVPLDINYGNRLKLVGWEQLETGDLLPQGVASRLQGANWKIALYWQTSGTLAEDYTMSVRPLSEGQIIFVDGEAVIQDHQPVWGSYPTSRWMPAEIVRDVYALSLPAGVNPEAVQIVVYRATEAGFENLAEAIVSLDLE
jgi:hypothetical protein